VKRLRLTDLTDTTGPNFLADHIEGRRISGGGLAIRGPGDCPHPERPHVHDGQEIFVALQGKARLEVDGEMHEFRMGDIVIIEPGEDHRYWADDEDPLVNLWFHAE
jgi:mannose-6-phosphate isomerase-like protein (cupin superfamily)